MGRKAPPGTCSAEEAVFSETLPITRAVPRGNGSGHGMDGESAECRCSERDCGINHRLHLFSQADGLGGYPNGPLPWNATDHGNPGILPVSNLCSACELWFIVLYHGAFAERTLRSNGAATATRGADRTESIARDGGICRVGELFNFARVGRKFGRCASLPRVDWFFFEIPLPAGSEARLKLAGRYSAGGLDRPAAIGGDAGWL